jgi:hypothetical protein
MNIPESISALSREHGVKWTLCIWALSFLGMCILTNLDKGWWAFAACVCLAIVGCMPLIEGKHNTLHNIVGTLACVLSQLWIVLSGNWVILLLWWIIYLIILPFIKSKWCFFAEIWCFTSILTKVIANFVF